MKVKPMIGVRLAHAVKTLLAYTTPSVTSPALECAYEDEEALDDIIPTLNKYTTMFFTPTSRLNDLDILDVRDKITSFDIPDVVITQANVNDALKKGIVTYNELLESLNSIVEAAKSLAVSDLKEDDEAAYYKKLYSLKDKLSDGYIPYGHKHLKFVTYELPNDHSNLKRVRYRLIVHSSEPSIRDKQIEAVPSFSNEMDVININPVDINPIKNCINLLISRLEYYLKTVSTGHTFREFTLLNDVLYDLLNFTMLTLGVIYDTVLESQEVVKTYTDTHIL